MSFIPEFRILLLIALVSRKFTDFLAFLDAILLAVSQNLFQS